MLESLKMTISRARLVEILEQERENLVADYKAVRDERALKVEAVPDTKTAILDWYVETAARLADGTYAIEDSGHIVGPQRNVLAPAKPTTASLAKQRRDIADRHYAAGSEQMYLEKFENVLSMLNHSTEDTLQIALGDYSDLIKLHAN